MRKTLWLVPLAGIAAVLMWPQRGTSGTGESLEKRIAQIQRVGSLPEISCADLAKTRPLVLLALGQSNAGNHGSGPEPASEPINLIADGKCVRSRDPLPGATGRGGSIWSHLPHLLVEGTGNRQIVLSVLAVDATSIADWTDPQRPLKNLLSDRIASMVKLGLPPSLILWQQGEADSRGGTTESDYTTGLIKLAAILDEAGSNAPLLLARSTLCKAAPETSIRDAIARTAGKNSRFRLGPDTDTLAGENYRMGCHLKTAGLESAARMWASAIHGELPEGEKTRLAVDESSQQGHRPLN